MSDKPGPTKRSTRAKAAPAAPAPVTRSTRARTAKIATPEPQPTPPLAKKSGPRKPLVSKDNTVDGATNVLKSKAKTTGGKKVNAKQRTPDTREPIMAYLRIRPQAREDLDATPYLLPISDTTVNMTNPHDPSNDRTKYRISTVPPSSIYKFSHVFPSSTTQSDFFAKTTLPLVQDVLTGQNGLLFTYGVTNSGKTYTVQGGTQQGAAGILPRSLDVIFNSIDGLQGDGKYRPVRLYGVELSGETDTYALPSLPEPALSEVLGPLDDSTMDFDADPTTVSVDRNYEYTVWVSYAEVYNEKVYDLLASVKEESGGHVDGKLPNGKSLLLTRQALPLRPSPASDTADSESNGKYIAGLRQFRVQTSAEAKELVRLGQLHRRVFGTLANRESSRSHGMVIIKVVRGHRGEREDPTSLQISRLTLVDLAGSERTKHTHTTGDRLKEAGNINKSLMVLGQCMEVMRSNQRKLAMSLAQDAKDGRVDTRDVKKGLTIVPFRHSKLTEALMDYFVGDGRTVMIVNVNPYDTGYDENSHVMKFAALAREVYVTPAPAPVQRAPNVGPGKTHGQKIKQLGSLTLKDPEIVPHPYSRKVKISLGGNAKGKKQAEAILEVREEDEPLDERDKEEEEDYTINPLVDALFDEVEVLRMQLYESEMRCALIEAEAREEVMREMEERMRIMEEKYARRLMNELEQNELKTDAKIDMLHQSGLFGSPIKRKYDYSAEVEEDDVEQSLIEYGDDESMEDDDESLLSSPLARKGEKNGLHSRTKSHMGSAIIVEKVNHFPDPPMLASDTEDAELTDEDEDEDEIETPSAHLSGITDSASESDNDDGSNKNDDDNYMDDTDDTDCKHPSSSKIPQTFKKQQPSTQSKAGRVSKLAQDLDSLAIGSTAKSRKR